MSIRVLFFFAITNMILSILGGWFVIQYTYTNTDGKLFSIPISIMLPYNLTAIVVNMLVFWASIGLLFGTWSWFIFNKMVKELIERFGSPQSVPEQAIHYINARHFTKVTIAFAIIWLLIGIAVVFLFKDPVGFTKYNSWLIIGGYFLCGGLCSFIAHKLLMKLGQIIGF